MKNTAKRIIPLTALALVLLSLAPLASASTLTVTLNPKTLLAKVDSVSTTKIVFTYPDNSTVSNYLRNVSGTYDVSGNFSGSTEGAHELQGAFQDDGGQISVQNASIAFNYSAKGNSTALVIDKTTTVTAWVSGVFRVVNGTVEADLGWRSYVVHGPLNFEMDGQMMDVNQVGATMQYSLGEHPLAAGFLLGAFSGWGIWNRPTLNFSQLNTPLSAWTKNYDSSTNTTTFTKTIAGSSTFTSSFDYNGQKYTFSAISDPTGVVSVPGYANAQDNSLVIAPAPSSTTGFLVIGGAIAIIAALAGYIAVKRGIRPKSPMMY